MKPCQHCGSPMPNPATTCEKCGGAWENRVRLETGGKPREKMPLPKIWREIPQVIILAGLGFYFFGAFGAIVGLALGAIIVLGF